MYPPFQLDPGLVPLTQFGWNKLANEPSRPGYLIGGRIAKVE
jgi:hypothetical protein